MTLFSEIWCTLGLPSNCRMFSAENLILEFFIMFNLAVVLVILIKTQMTRKRVTFFKVSILRVTVQHGRLLCSFVSDIKTMLDIQIA